MRWVHVTCAFVQRVQEQNITTIAPTTSRKLLPDTEDNSKLPFAYSTLNCIAKFIGSVSTICQSFLFQSPELKLPAVLSTRRRRGRRMWAWFDQPTAADSIVDTLRPGLNQATACRIFENRSRAQTFTSATEAQSHRRARPAVLAAR